MPAVAAPRDPARPAVVAPSPVARVPTRSAEPPPWAEEPIWDEEAPPGATITSREPAADAAPPVPPPAAPQPPVNFVPDEIGDRWAQLVTTMVEAGSIGALTRELAMQAQCLSFETQGERSVWRLRVERETLRAPGQRDKLQAALGALLQQNVLLELEPGVATDSPALRAAAERLRRQAEAEHLIHNDPLVQTLMQQFKTARIVPGSIKFH